VDITPSEVYRFLDGANRLPTTSAPSPAAYLEAYEDQSRRADSVLCITLPPELTMVHQSAMQAREVLSNTIIKVMDCRSAAGGQGLVTQ